MSRAWACAGADGRGAALEERAGVEVFGLDPARGVAIEIMLDMAQESARASFRTVAEPQGRVVELSADDTLIERLAVIAQRFLQEAQRHPRPVGDVR